jgi:V/A-type H+-transporting ATPase subunit D
MSTLGSRRATSKAELLKIRSEAAIALTSMGLLENKRDLLLARGMELLQQSVQLRQQLTKRWSDIEQMWEECIAMEGVERLSRLADEQKALPELKGEEGGWMSFRLAHFVLEQPELEPFGAVFDCGLCPDRVRGRLADALPDLQQLMNIETNVRRIAISLKRCQRQINALSHIILPELEGEKVRIARGLEEREREALFQVKRMRGGQ